MAEIKYTLVRKRIKNINLRINSKGELIVSAPYLCTKKRIEEVIVSKAKWILQKQQEAVNRKTNQFVREEDIKSLCEKIELFLVKWEAITGLKSSSWKLKKMTSRWGSCNFQTRNLNFSTMLCGKSDDVIEAVVLHELAHIKYPNHSKDYYNYILGYMPDYKDRKKELKKD